MDEESPPVIATLLIVVGLAILLYGVSLNSGQSINMPMIAGGVVVLVAMGIFAGGLMMLE
ncbi:MAG: hypothetical protein SV377_01690 [Halobacteria archaeon]|nr:hypothetical protein [Halobacteria archaeon]